MKILYITVAFVLILLTGGYLYLEMTNIKIINTQKVQILSFGDCVKAGNIVLETYPRQCKNKDGKTFTEEIKEKITYNNSSADLIQVDLPYPGAVTGKDFSIVGKARGTWYFEASFPVQVLDKDGKVLFEGPVQAQGEWMTTEFVPFKVDIIVPQTYIGRATIILKKDNPSGDTAKDASISFPITIE